jgi:hypothetical protein
MAAINAEFTCMQAALEAPSPRMLVAQLGVTLHSARAELASFVLLEVAQPVQPFERVARLSEICLLHV